MSDCDRREFMAALSATAAGGEPRTLADVPAARKPLFRDPIYDGAADPVVLWNRGEKRWFMFYTNRRANMSRLPGVSWVHGTRIGIAQSLDHGHNWTYRGTAGITCGNPEYTYWAPDVIDDGSTYHMYLTVVPGTFHDWNAPRDIVHLTSTDLLDWTFRSKLNLASDRVIDATVAPVPEGHWRMWYKNERDKSHIYFADSQDLYSWKHAGVAITDVGSEGAKVFRWKGRYWMIVDVWKGISVYSSSDCRGWSKQPDNVLQDPGLAPTDAAKGGHADVVVNGGRAWLFYFVHQRIPPVAAIDPTWERRTVIQVVELHHNKGRLYCDRNQPARLHLEPPRANRTN